MSGPSEEPSGIGAPMIDQTADAAWVTLVDRLKPLVTCSEVVDAPTTLPVTLICSPLEMPPKVADTSARMNPMSTTAPSALLTSSVPAAPCVCVVCTVEVLELPTSVMRSVFSLSSFHRQTDCPNGAPILTSPSTVLIAAMLLKSTSLMSCRNVPGTAKSAAEPPAWVKYT